MQTASLTVKASGMAAFQCAAVGLRQLFEVCRVMCHQRVREEQQQQHCKRTDVVHGHLLDLALMQVLQSKAVMTTLPVLAAQVQQLVVALRRMGWT